jgi:hypothetical protein
MISQHHDERESVGVLRWLVIMVAIAADFLLIYYEPLPLVR